MIAVIGYRKEKTNCFDGAMPADSEFSEQLVETIQPQEAHEHLKAGKGVCGLNAKCWLLSAVKWRPAPRSTRARKE